MKTRLVFPALLTAAALGGLTLAAPSAKSQVTGRIYLTTQQVPTDAKGRILRKTLRAHRTTTLKKDATADSWTAYGFAKLRSRPSKKLMKLAYNSGKIQVIVKHRVKRRWLRQHVGSIVYDKRVRFVRFELSLSDDHKIPLKRNCQLQLVVQNRRKRDVVLAKTTFSIR